MVSYRELTVLSTIQFTRFLKENRPTEKRNKSKSAETLCLDKQKYSLNRHFVNNSRRAGKGR